MNLENYTRTKPRIAKVHRIDLRSITIMINPGILLVCFISGRCTKNRLFISFAYCRKLNTVKTIHLDYTSI